MPDNPENAPEHCPGTQSEEAGKSSACNGCPNQKICSSGKSIFNFYVKISKIDEI